MEKKKVYQVTPAMKKALAPFYGGFADMKDTNETIGRMYNQNGYLMDTHTAVAYKVYENYLAETGDHTPALIASTASAYKFADSVADAIGIGKGKDGFASVDAIQKATKVPVPSGLLGLQNKPIRHKEVVEVDQMAAAVKTALKDR